MRVVLAGADEELLMRVAYPALAAAGFDVAAVVSDAGRLTQMVAVLGDEVLVVVEGDLYATPEAAEAALKALPVSVALVLPAVWSREQERFAALPNLVAGVTAPISWAQIAAELKQRRIGAKAVDRGRQMTDDGRRTTDDGRPTADDGRRMTDDGRRTTDDRRPTADDGQRTAFVPQPPPSPSPNLPTPNLPTPNLPARRLLTFWSGPMGGSGRTTLALLLALLAAERGVETLLLALAEPAVSAILRLPRMPNATVFFESGNLSAARQRVTFAPPSPNLPSPNLPSPKLPSPSFPLSVMLGPARARDGAVEREKIGGLIEAARAASGLVVADLPALVPGGNPWTLEPLKRADDVVLVLPPTGMGVTAAVEGLATLRDIGAAGRVYLALNRRAAAGGVSAQEFAAGVTAVWGSSPPVVTVVPFVAALPGVLEQGELPDDRRLAVGIEQLAEAVLGLRMADDGRRAADHGRRAADDRRQMADGGRRVTEDRRRTTDDEQQTAGRPRRRLISIEVTD